MRCLQAETPAANEMNSRYKGEGKSRAKHR